jgi:hypothetical protein
MAWHCNYSGAALFAEFIDSQAEHVSDGVLDRFDRALAVPVIHRPVLPSGVFNRSHLDLLLGKAQAMTTWFMTIEADYDMGVQAGVVLFSCHPNPQDRVGTFPMGPAIDERAG